MAFDAAAHDPYAALRVRDFRRLLAGNIAVTIGMEAQGAAVGWELYERTRSPLALGMVGLVQFLPMLVLTLPAGHVADHTERRRVLIGSMLLAVVSSLGLAAVSAAQGAVLMMYAFLLLNGVARSLRGPAYQALAAQLVSRELFPNAATWRSTGFQLAAMLGPGVGGTMLAAFQLATPVYLVGAAAALVNILMLVPIARPATPPPRAEMTLASLATGIRFVGRTQELLASITLDLFAVLLGGATTLLPVFAKDILHVGPRELGWMLAAPSFGALVMALALAYRRTMRRAGTLLLRSVAAFGVATILFGLSRSLWLSLGLLTLLGAFDSISVVIRSTLIQQLTPDEMRGRVAAVNSIFIGTSNELGGFESGAVAAVIGPVGSVVVGGIGTLVVVAAVAKVWPKIREAELGAGGG